MSRPTFLTQKFHDTPPKFNSAERQTNLYLDTAFEEEVLSTVRGSANKAYISLAYCYFKIHFQFFDRAFQKDLQYFAKRFSVKEEDFHWDDYHRNSKNSHQIKILAFMGFLAFDSPKAKKKVGMFIEHQAKIQKNFKSCFYNIAVKLHQEKIEIPSYDVLQSLILQTYTDHKNKLLKIVESNLTKEKKEILDELFDKGLKDGSQKSQYRLTLLKRFTHSLKPGKIAENIKSFDNLNELFLIAEPIIKKLDLNDNGIHYYATTVKKQQIFQIKRRQDNARHLYLLAFITHQFYRLQDILVDTLIACVTAAYNIAHKKAKEYYYKKRNEQSRNTGELVGLSQEMLEAIECVKVVLRDNNLDDATKVQQALLLLAPKKSLNNNIRNVIDSVKSDLDKMSGEALFYHFLEEGSLKLQRRCSEIIKRLSFNQQVSSKSLLAAINRYKDKGGAVNGQYPIGFMSPSEKHYIDTKDEFKSKLYKVSLFNHIKDALKGDALSLTHSYRFKKLDLYLICSDVWKKTKLSCFAQRVWSVT